jgi:hypothetical protein
MEKVKRYAFKTLVIVVFVTLQLFILNPAVAVSDCNIVCEGSFVIDDIETIPSLEGLECLAHVGGSLDISINRSLTSLAGLNNLESVGGNLVIWYNHCL